MQLQTRPLGLCSRAERKFHLYRKSKQTVNPFALAALLHYWTMKQEPFDVNMTPITDFFSQKYLTSYEQGEVTYSIDMVELLQIQKSEELNMVPRSEKTGGFWRQVSV